MLALSVECCELMRRGVDVCTADQSVDEATHLVCGQSIIFYLEFKEVKKFAENLLVDIIFFVPLYCLTHTRNLGVHQIMLAY